jgi:hypothetical protein
MQGGRVLIVTWDGGGNVPPALALAERLAALGHAVRVSAPESMRPRVDARGARLAPYRSLGELPTDLDLETIWERVDTFLNGRSAMDELLNALGDEPADVIVVDSMHGAGLAVAELLDLPTAVLAHTLYRRWTQWAPAIMSLAATRATAGSTRPGRPIRVRRPRPLRGRPRPDAGGARRPRGPNPPATPTWPDPVAGGCRLAAAGLSRPERRRPAAGALITFGSTFQRQGEALVPVLVPSICSVPTSRTCGRC